MSSVPSQEEETNVYFIVPKKYGDEEQCSGDIKMAFQSCVEHDLCPEWITEDLALKLQPVKKDVFVFEEFVGDAFNYLRKFKSLIVGARCILACLIEGTPIPDGVSPVFTVAMRGLIVTSTAFDDPVKKSLMEKIEFMGGVYTAKFRQTVTHVVAKAVGTTKCEIATKNGIPVMTEDWVSCVWEASQQRNIHATDDEFMKYKCPIFHGLLITCSGLPRKEKEAVKELISKNGGEFSGALESERTKVLLISEPAGDKFKYAQRWSLPCLLPTWIHDSVKAGHALPIEDYRLKVEMRKCSTPEKNQSKFLPDFSVMSSIQSSEKYVDETLLNSTEANMYSVRPSGRISINVQEDGPPKSSGRISDVDKYMDMVDKLNLTEAKKAKIFLDGCNVYLSGFNAERTEKLRRVLNGGGATRFNEISDAVTHVILGEFVASDIKLLKESGLRPHVVTVEWLIQSIKLRSPAPEEQFSCFEHSLSPRAEPPSPLSKKGLQLLQSAPSPSIRPLNIDSEPQATDAVKPPSATAKPDELVQQYLQSSQSVAENCLQKIEEVCPEPESRKDITAPCNPDTTTQPDHETTNSTQFTTQASTVAEIFKGLMFVISGYPENQTSEMEEMIRECGGRLVTRNFKGVADYGIVPVYGGTLVQATNEIVTHRWLGDCYDKEAILPVMYYHQPVTLDLELKPLRGCVLGITTYTGSCRSFIMELAEALGALTQEMFARVDSKAKGAKASSHLICPGPGGHKYAAALKWKLPAVTHEWLLACAREGRRVPEEPYLVLENSSVGLESKESVSSDKTRLSQSNQCDKPPPVYKRLQEIMGPPNTPRSSTSMPECHPRLSGSSPADTRNSPVNNSSTPSGRGNVHTPVTGNQREWPWDMNQPTPKGPNYVSTPETPYGAVFEPNPSPNTRKQWKRYIDNFPQFPRDEPLSKKRRQSTPLSELKRQCWAKFGGVDNSETPKSEERPSSKDHDQPLSELDKVRQKLPLDEEPYENSRMNNSAAKSMESNPSPRSSSGATGINTSIDPRLRAFEICLLGSQLMELNEILTSASKMEALRSTRGTSSIAGTPQSSSGEEKINNAPPASASLPESADVNADCVEWVDPIISHNTQQELRAGSKRRSLKIMLSSVEDREHCENIITALGGTVTTNVSYDPSASHLVCNRPARSEKLLCSIASGKWVLHRSFLDRSQQEGHFLQEESFEWGNPKAATLMQTLKPGSIECLLALAAHRWRMKLQNRSSGAFEGMKAIIHTTPDKLESYKRLIISGGGEVLDLRPPFSNPGDATVCLIDQNKVNTPVDFEALVRNDVPCVPPIFLNNFLVSDTLLDPRSCIIPQYKAAMESRK